MKIFVSYRHKDQIVALQIAEKLRQYSTDYVFFDERSIDKADFEDSILGHLRQSDVVVVVVSEHTFAPDRVIHDDDWVRREVREALQLSKHIVPVCVNNAPFPPIHPLPPDIANITRMNKLELHSGDRVFDAGIQTLLDFLYRITGMQGESILQKTTDALRLQDYADAKRELTKVLDLLDTYAGPQYVARRDFYQALILFNGKRPSVQTLPVVRKVGEYIDAALRRHRTAAYLLALSLFYQDFSRHLTSYRAEAARLLAEVSSLPWTQEDTEILMILRICQPDLVRDYLDS